MEYLGWNTPNLRLFVLPGTLGKAKCVGSFDSIIIIIKYYYQFHHSLSISFDYTATSAAMNIENNANVPLENAFEISKNS